MSSMSTPAPSVTRAFKRSSPGEAIRLGYKGDAPIIISGPVSGRLYRIERDARELAADPRDVPALVATGRFSRLTGED
jgi:hypothetical protein